MNVKEVLVGKIAGDKFAEMNLVKNRLVRMAEKQKMRQQARQNDYENVNLRTAHRKFGMDN
jgi:hypothetical protein